MSEKIKEKLLPCPHCGGENVAPGDFGECVNVACIDCGAEGPHIVKQGDGFEHLMECLTTAKKQWNTRTEPNTPLLVEARDAIEALFKDMKMRIDAQDGLPDHIRTCGGEKGADGIYTFPWGNGVNYGLYNALTKLNKLLKG